MTWLHQGSAWQLVGSHGEHIVLVGWRGHIGTRCLQEQGEVRELNRSIKYTWVPTGKRCLSSFPNRAFQTKCVVAVPRQQPLVQS